MSLVESPVQAIRYFARHRRQLQRVVHDVIYFLQPEGIEVIFADQPADYSAASMFSIELAYNCSYAFASKRMQMSQIEHHGAEVSNIEIELMRKMVALGLDWHDEAVMRQLATECKAFGPADAKAAYASNDRERMTKAQLFALASLMIRTMESAALEGREVHGGEVWKAFGKHLYT